MEDQFISDKETQIQKSPRAMYKLTYDEYESCKKLQRMLFTDMNEANIENAAIKISKIVNVVFPDAEIKQLKSDDPKLAGWEIEYKKGRPYLYIYMNTDNMRPMLIDQMRFDITQPSIFHLINSIFIQTKSIGTFVSFCFMWFTPVFFK